MITREQAKRLAEVAQALVDGKKVTIADEEGTFVDVAKYGFGIHINSLYTIHEPPPEPKYRAFKNAEEIKPHRNCWVRWPMEFGGEFMRIDRYGCHGITIAGEWLSFQRAFELVVFDDNSPFGVSE
jgi:hypothetical protein